MTFAESVAVSINNFKSAGLSFAQVRESAREHLAKKNIPTTRQEEWKYTNVAKFYQDGYLSFSEQKSSIDFSEYICADNYLVFENGNFNLEKSSISNELKKIVNVTSFSEKTETTEAFGLVKPSEKSCYFSDLNASLFKDLLSVKINSELEDKTLQVINVVNAGFAAPRIFVEVGQGCELELVETYIGSKTSFTCPVSEYHVQDDATLSVRKMVIDSKDSLHIGEHESKLGEKSRFNHFVLNYSAGTIRNVIKADIAGENSFAELLGVNLLDGKEHVDNQTVLDHSVPNCESYEDYKGIYAENSKGIFSGTIIVRPDAQKTNAVQSNQAILLSDDATNYSQPQLKIWADDVKCTHGATCGELDEDALFYLQTRGLNLNLAKKMLIEAFLKSLLLRIDNERIVKLGLDLITKKLNSVI